MIYDDTDDLSAWMESLVSQREPDIELGVKGWKVATDLFVSIIMYRVWRRYINRFFESPIEASTVSGADRP